MSIMAKGRTVVIGMTGRIDSTVAAYLLKKQGFNCIGVTVVVSDQKNGSTFSECQKTDLNLVREICKKLEFPFFAISGSEQYDSSVTDRAVGAKLSGKNCSACFYCHRLKAELLISKLAQLKADFVATGHFARVVTNPRTGFSALHMANDRDNDQSHLLSLLPEEALKKIVFPLADLRKEEVVKIFGTLEIKSAPAPTTMGCFSSSPVLNNYINDRVAPSLRQSGGIFSHADESFVGEHEGIFRYTVAQNNVTPSSNHVLDPTLVITKLDAAKRQIFVGIPEKLHYRKMELTRFTPMKDCDLSKPKTVYLKIENSLKKIPCVVHFKADHVAVLEFDDTITHLVAPGTAVTLFNRDDLGAMVIASGEVNRVGPLIEFSRIPKDRDDEEEEDTSTLSPEELEEKAKKRKPKHDYVF